LAILMALVPSHWRGVGSEHRIPKSANNQRSQIISVVVARALSSIFALDRETVVCLLDFHAIGENAVACCRTTINMVTSPCRIRISMKLRLIWFRIKQSSWWCPQ
jgi:hypothetical protein